MEDNMTNNYFKLLNNEYPKNTWLENEEKDLYQQLRKKNGRPPNPDILKNYILIMSAFLIFLILRSSLL